MEKVQRQQQRVVTKLVYLCCVSLPLTIVLLLTLCTLQITILLNFSSSASGSWLCQCIEVLGSATPCIMADLAVDPTACPASQILCRMFLNCYIFTVCWTPKSHDKSQMRASLKLNSAVLAESTFELPWWREQWICRDMILNHKLFIYDDRIDITLILVERSLRLTVIIQYYLFLLTVKFTIIDMFVDSCAN